MAGSSFCSAAKDSLYLMIRNIARFQVVAGLGDIFVRFGQFFIASASALLGYLIITRTGSYAEEMNSPIAPTLVNIIIKLFLQSNLSNNVTLLKSYFSLLDWRSDRCSWEFTEQLLIPFLSCSVWMRKSRRSISRDPAQLIVQSRLGSSSNQSRVKRFLWDFL